MCVCVSVFVLLQTHKMASAGYFPVKLLGFPTLEL